MTPCEKCLLENMLDALDRLFDQQSSVIDVWALLFATGEALRDTPHYPEFVNPSAELSVLIRSAQPEKAERETALKITDNLRHYLAGLPLN